MPTLIDHLEFLSLTSCRAMLSSRLTRLSDQTGIGEYVGM